MAERTTKADVVVIGGGIAGTLAAWGAAQKGAQVLLAHASRPSTALSSGAFAPLPRRFLDQSWAEERGELTSFLCDGALYGPPSEGHPIALSSVGALVPKWLVQRFQADLSASLGVGTIAVAGLASSRRFSPTFLAAALEAQIKERGSNASVEVFGPLHCPSLDMSQPLRVAHALDDPSGRALDELGKALSRASFPATSLVVLPPILGLDRSAAVARELAERAGAPLAEALGGVANAGGVRLERFLRHKLKESKARVICGRVVSAERQDRRVVELRVCPFDGTDPERISAQAFVLATGGFPGGGFDFDTRRVEPLFGLDLVLDGKDLPPPATLHGHDPSRLFAENPMELHPLFRVGVKVGEDQRPEALQNLFVAGALLPESDPVKNGGLGAAALTGLRAGWSAAG